MGIYKRRIGDVMDNANGKIMTQPEKVKYIITKSCEYLGIDPNILPIAKGGRSKIWHKKRFVAYILSNNTILSYEEIAKLTGYCNHSLVSYHNKIMEEELSKAVYGSEKTKMIYKELMSYLKLNNHGNKENDQRKETNKEG